MNTFQIIITTLATGITIAWILDKLIKDEEYELYKATRELPPKNIEDYRKRDFYEAVALDRYRNVFSQYAYLQKEKERWLYEIREIKSTEQKKLYTERIKGIDSELKILKEMSKHKYVSVL